MECFFFVFCKILIRSVGYTLCVTMRNGIGVSVINSLSEELVYGRMSGISLFASLKGNYQMTASIDSIQVGKLKILESNFTLRVN